ncbi:hypothetical protein NAEGRDRAFT_80833 [Naegleria gruberi]|uniref:T4 RNA ligase 1-like N-terminal domain-containing protein n=1 Tax=Naegleria gruberi TaxID=5762 RepID=D2VQ00_NAEGR|nr:uncharacterized protein NAEGRDRAFT_80833 [Naegleria gruberi]EFC41021.1 hypothetical protein NAEGRDRAFT_80833 [Naegleria gruberi]|eukprot:XP_002673765.1 hypothetical protein NAEGRDRAFT_80833 [Naegleria gruberi strain NEG-M]
MFPVIKFHSDIESAIKGRKEFVTQVDEGFRFIKYKSIVENTFADQSTMKDMTDRERLDQLIRRECRGIIFEEKSKKIVCRKFHKFFNINERVESNIEKINWKRPFVVVEKMDGSLVSPIFVSSKRDISDIRFTTMLGFTAMAKNMVAGYIDKNLAQKNLRKPFLEFCKYCLDQGWSCSFEYTGPQNIVVIKYLEEKLTLLAIRHTESGEYLTYQEMKDILDKNPNWQKAVNLVSLWKDFPQGTEEPQKLLSEIYEQKGLEGYVIRFNDGDFYKAKTKYYMCFHGIADNSSEPNKQGSSSMFSAEKIRERHIVKAILSDVIDDVISGVFWTTEMKQVVSKYRIELETKILAKFEEEIWPILKKAISFSKKGVPNESITSRVISGKLATTFTGDFIKDMISKLSKEESSKNSNYKNQESDEEEEEFDSKPSQQSRGNMWSVLQEEEIEDAEQDAKLDNESDGEKEEKKLEETIQQTSNLVIIEEEQPTQSISFDISGMKFAPIKPTEKPQSEQEQIESQKNVAYECYKIFLQTKIFQVSEPKAFETKKSKVYDWLNVDLKSGIMGNYAFDSKTGSLVKNSTRKVLTKPSASSSKHIEEDDHDFSNSKNKKNKKRK